jgi:hypothetical protein
VSGGIQESSVAFYRHRSLMGISGLGATDSEIRQKSSEFAVSLFAAIG